MSGIRRVVHLSAFVRTFTIQGSWNYRTMLGTGFGFALAPFLKEVFRDDPDGLRRARWRHREYFNAHPYLAGFALGAVARLEAEGRDPRVIRRFKEAIGGSLGSLGDNLVWAAWLPSTLVAALVAALLMKTPWAVIVTFLVIYNAGHLLLRAWGFRRGFQEGLGLGEVLEKMDLRGVTERIFKIGAFLMGALTGVGAMKGGELFAAAPAWIPLLALGFVLGHLFRQAAWKPAAALTAVGVAALTLYGFLR